MCLSNFNVKSCRSLYESILCTFCVECASDSLIGVSFQLDNIWRNYKIHISHNFCIVHFLLRAI